MTYVGNGKRAAPGEMLLGRRGTSTSVLSCGPPIHSASITMAVRPVCTSFRSMILVIRAVWFSKGTVQQSAACTLTPISPKWEMRTFAIQS
jgi:hypothetical protein